MSEKEEADTVRFGEARKAYQILEAEAVPGWRGAMTMTGLYWPSKEAPSQPDGVNRRRKLQERMIHPANVKETEERKCSDSAPA